MEILWLTLTGVILATIVLCIEPIITRKTNNKSSSDDLVQNTKTPLKEDPDNTGFDIVQFPNGQFSPTYLGKYLFITVEGRATIHDTPWYKNLFNDKKDALALIEKWKRYKGIGTKSVGLDIEP